jgi:type IV pilus assembly protein PilA
MLKKKKNKKGFTLIELLIVVAIIAILAAIAIPQFSSYRIKGYNSAATADLRNARTAEEAFFSDWQAYASTVADAVGGKGTAVDATFFNNAAFTIAKGKINGTAPSADTTFTTGVSQNVLLLVNTDAGGQTFTMSTKNSSGDRCFGMDSNVTSVYWVNGETGVSMGNDAVPASTAADDLIGVVGGTGCKGNPAGKGQLTWVAL